MAGKKAARNLGTIDPRPLAKVIEDAMWDQYNRNKRISFDLDSVCSLVVHASTHRGTISATLSNMRDKSILMDMPKVKGYNGRMVNCYALTAVAELATKPEASKRSEMDDGQTIDLGPVTVGEPGPTATPYVPTKNVKLNSVQRAGAYTAKPGHTIDRPPVNSPSKEEFERKASAEASAKPKEKTAGGLAVTSVPAGDFTHHDGNVASGKVTTSRDPRKPQDPDAIVEMVQHIANTATPTQETENEMAAGVPKQGTPEYNFVQLDRRIDRLENLVNQALEGIGKSNREGLAKQAAANSTFGELLEAQMDRIHAYQQKDTEKSEKVLADFIASLNENNDVFKAVIHEILSIYVESATSNKTHIRLMGKLMESNGNLLDEVRNSALTEARAYIRGFEAARSERKEMAKADELAEIVTAQDSANEAAIRADEIARRLVRKGDDGGFTETTDTVKAKAFVLDLGTGTATDLFSGKPLN